MPTLPIRQSPRPPGPGAIALGSRFLRFLLRLLAVAVRLLNHHAPRSASGPENSPIRPQNPPKTLSRQPEPLRGSGWRERVPPP